MNHVLSALASLCALFGGVRDDGARVTRDPGPRAEYFVLELPGTDPAPADLRDVGAVCLRRRVVDGGFQLEGEWLFRRSEEEGGDERVLHVEQILHASSRLIWREWGPSRARSLAVDRSAEGCLLSIVDSGRGGTGRDTIAAVDAAVMPLELLERIRLAEAVPASCERFDPLSRSLERVEVRLLSNGAQGAQGAQEAEGAQDGETKPARIVQIARADGSIAGRYEFVGSELRSFRSQDGDLVARRITEEEYRTRTPLPTVSIQRP